MTSFHITLIAHITFELIFIGRVLLRPNREPTSRLAWLLVIIVLPVLGILLYLLLGETNIGRKRLARLKDVESKMPKIPPVKLPDGKLLEVKIPSQFAHLFHLGTSISGFEPVGGNRASLLADSNATIDRMVEDIDAAQSHVHLLFYIWLADNNGTKIMEALKRAAKRGVVCRVLADDLGSRALIRSQLWRALKESGVRAEVALPIGSFLIRIFKGRIDLRNHRKIVVVDGNITYCGSQNCADPEFRIKSKYAPWVDVVARFEGPIARENQRLFIEDWMAITDENLHSLLTPPLVGTSEGFAAQVIGTGPTVRFSAMPEMFEALIDAARKDLIISTPYYVPTESLQSALCSAAYRGVRTTIIFPKKNDSWIVAGASRSHYAGLLDAGAQIYEYVGGLLHAKSLTVDGEIALIGSANMDRRSFDLNYENNILLCDQKLTGELLERQKLYLAKSQPVNRSTVDSWSAARRIWNNTLAVLSPVL